MIGIIYRATFPNGKCYIGQTVKTLEHRIAAHYSRVGDSLPFHNAIMKYGTACIVWEVIDTVDSIEALNEREVYWIKFYGSYINNLSGYNVTLGGKGKAGYAHSEESRAKNRAAHIGKKASDETRAKMSVARKNKTHSTQWCANISAGIKGKKHPSASGDLNHRAKLTWGKVREIRARYIPFKVSFPRLAKEYGVGITTIRHIVNDRTWKVA
jgi:group I intron endonuclease